MVTSIHIQLCELKRLINVITFISLTCLYHILRDPHLMFAPKMYGILVETNV